MNFRDRTDAGRQLATALGRLRGRTDLLVLGLPRGGVPVAAEVAWALAAPLDLCFAHKISAPDNPEYAIGAVGETGPPYVEEHIVHSMRIPFSYIREEAAFQQKDLVRRAAHYRGLKPAPLVEGKWVILVDDGVATGSTAHAALLGLRQQKPARLIFATPVAAADTMRRLVMDADDVTVLHASESFTSVGEFYEMFRQVSDGEVMEMLRSAPAA